MSIFSRVRDLLSANINAMLDAAEDPEKMADEYLRQLNNELYEAKTSVAAAMAGSVVATGAVCASDDLSGKTMLGDFGANALGAGLGYAVASSPLMLVRAGVLGIVVALTLASEKVSFSKVIESNPVLSWVDQLGRS